MDPASPSNPPNQIKLPISVWENRRADVNAIVDELLQRVLLEQIPTAQTVRSLLNNLQSFGKDQFDYFKLGFENNKLAKLDTLDPADPDFGVYFLQYDIDDFVLRTTL